MQKLVLASLSLLALSAACQPETIKTAPERRGARGESCLVTNDCKSSLLCVASRCIDEDFALEATAKVCVNAECIDKKDCCPSKSKPELARCASLKQECAADEFSFACQQLEQQCGECKQTCENHSCVSTEKPVGGCTSNSECDTDFGETCIDGVCAECVKDADCGADHVCETGSCTLGCLRAEDCGPLSACKGARCEARDCADDRECVAFTGRPDAVCAKSGACSIPCDNDGGCASLGGLFSCDEGFCTYAGCDTNAECAAQASGNGGGFGGLKLCLDQAEADKVTFGGP